MTEDPSTAVESTATEPAETRRDQLRRKVAESQASLSRPQVPERDPPEGYKALAMDYPFAIVLGGLALGAIAGALLPRSAARKLVRGAVAAAGVAGELGLTYGRQALDAAGDLTGNRREKLGTIGEKLAELGETVSEAAGAYGRKAADLAGDAAATAGKAAGKAAESAGDAAGSARDSGMKIARQVIRLTSQLRH